MVLTQCWFPWGYSRWSLRVVDGVTGLLSPETLGQPSKYSASPGSAFLYVIHAFCIKLFKFIFIMIFLGFDITSAIFKPRYEKTGFLHMRKHNFAYAKTKTQISFAVTAKLISAFRGNREADQRLCFRYTNSTIPLLSKSEISSL